MSYRFPALIPHPQIITWQSGGSALEPLSETTSPDATPFAASSPDAYRLVMTEAGSVLSAVDGRGLCQGHRTLSQFHEQSVPPGGMDIRDWPALPFRAVHLDLKFHPPRFDALLPWLDQLAAWKLNTLVVEYEDRFPYEKVSYISHPKAFTRDQIRELVSKAGSLGIQVVPLLQCLGHVEYILWHKEYAHLRELPHVLSQYCPGKPESLELFKAMAEEMLDLHPDISYMHIGGDETAFLGQCPTCAKRAETANKFVVYIDYVKKVCEWVIAKGIRPIVWDDIIRKEPELIPELIPQLPRSTVLAHWRYGATGTRHDDRKTPKKLAAGGDLLAGRPEIEMPYIQYVEAGYDVITVPCYADGGLVPIGNAANCRHMAEEAALYGGLGVCATHWAVQFGQPRWALHGLAATADAAWNPLPGHADTGAQRHGGLVMDFDHRFCRQVFGLLNDSLVHALRRLGGGPMYCPPPDKGIGTLFATVFYADMSFLDPMPVWTAQMAAYFRPDWDTPVKNFEWEKAWQAKVAAIKKDPFLSYIKVQLHGLAEQYEDALIMFLEEKNKAQQNTQMLDGIEVGARMRMFRLRQLRYELGEAPRPEPQPHLKEQLEAFYALQISPEDAKQLAEWQSVGLDTGG